MPEPKPYLDCQRHILLDMHIPDWDERFLSEFDPESYANLCASTGAEAAMVYCNSHAGQCYWPTGNGQVHRNLGGRDVVGESVDLLHQRGLSVCAYYSAIFNNWAYLEHPEWRLVASVEGGLTGPGTRYGQCCPANRDYLEFMLRQTEELASAYPFDAFFYDMVFWPDVCICESCQHRFRDEAGFEIPEIVDWTDPGWCGFQAARERWLADAFRELRARVKQSLAVPVFHNNGLLECNWVGGASAEIVALNDLLGGDPENRSVHELSGASTPSVIQCMYPISGYGGGCSDLSTSESQEAQAMAAVAYGGQFMAIDAVEPDGKVNSLAYERLEDIFATMRPYQQYLGGRPLQEVGVYHSTSSRVDLRQNGTRIDRLEEGAPIHPIGAHWRGLEGALRALSRAHLPVGALSRADLARLAEVPVIVLPSVIRMDDEEVEAFRRYVAAGGRLYASAYTSLLPTAGGAGEDFQLAEVLGCRFAGEATEANVFLRPAVDELAAVLAPQDYVAVGQPMELVRRLEPTPAPAVLRVTAEDGAEVLATVTLPYRGGRGSRDDHDWANVHSSPPWEDTERPAVVRHRFGAGEVIYSAVDLEGASGRLAGASQGLFVALVRMLLERPRFEADAHPNARTTVFHEPARSRFRVCVLNAPTDTSVPRLPLPQVRFRLASPQAARFTGLRRLPDGERLDFELTSDGSLRADLGPIDVFEMVSAEYQE
jgi:hypothetical protein